MRIDATTARQALRPTAAIGEEGDERREHHDDDASREPRQHRMVLGGARENSSWNARSSTFCPTAVRTATR